MTPLRLVLMAAALLGLGGCTEIATQSADTIADVIRRATFTDEVAIEPAARPRYAPGDSFAFTKGRTERVTAVHGDRVTWDLSGKQVYVTNGNFALPRLEWQRAKDHGESKVTVRSGELWPLESGARARYTVVSERTKTKSGQTRRRDRVYHCTVEKTERISVPAGAFDTFRVECLRYNRSGSRIVLQRIWHYAPEVGHYVRREIVNKSAGTRKVVELVSYTRTPATR